MQCVLREKLMAQSIKLSEISRIYQVESYRFVDSYIEWLDETEKELSSLRVPISTLLQAEKTKLISVMDGYVPEYIQNSKSLRKIQRAVSAQSLSKISQDINSKITSLDLFFEQLHEKISHAIAVIAGKDSGFYNSICDNKISSRDMWLVVSNTPETRPIYNYLSAKISMTDRDYLMINVIDNIKNNNIYQDVILEKKPLETLLVSLLQIVDSIGLSSFEGLLISAKTVKDRRLLAREKGVSKKDLLALVKCADLMRIQGVNLPEAYVLFLSGIDSVAELGRRSSVNLTKKSNELIKSNRFEIDQFVLTDVKKWIDFSKNMPKIFSL